jgi:hypothetical protein
MLTARSSREPAEANAKVIALFRCTQMVLHGQR